jgi:hypothetical protein
MGRRILLLSFLASAGVFVSSVSYARVKLSQFVISAPPIRRRSMTGFRRGS